MKKFIVDKVELMELDGFKYYAIFDKDNKDWYEQQKDFEAGTLHRFNKGNKYLG